MARSLGGAVPGFALVQPGPRKEALPLSEGNELDDRSGQPGSPTYGRLAEREIFPKPDDPKVTRIVRYESVRYELGSGEVMEIIDVPDPYKAAE